MDINTCNFCCSKLKKRKYVYGAHDDNNDIFCENENCILNIKSDVNFSNQTVKVEYGCNECGRTLTKNDNENDYDLSVWWLMVHNDGCNYCQPCEQHLLNSKSYDYCNICGKVCKNNECQYNHDLINKTDYGSVKFVKNKDGKKCIYCQRYLMKCLMCDEPCYVCVFYDDLDKCSKSQLNGVKQNIYSYLCVKHAVSAKDDMTEETRAKLTNSYFYLFEKHSDCLEDQLNEETFVSVSNTLCEQCGINEIICRPYCHCWGVQDGQTSLCVNCHDKHYSLDKLYCFYCHNDCQ